MGALWHCYTRLATLPPWIHLLFAVHGLSVFTSAQLEPQSLEWGAGYCGITMPHVSWASSQCSHSNACRLRRPTTYTGLKPLWALPLKWSNSQFRPISQMSTTQFYLSCLKSLKILPTFFRSSSTPKRIPWKSTPEVPSWHAGHHCFARHRAWLLQKTPGKLPGMGPTGYGGCHGHGRFFRGPVHIAIFSIGKPWEKNIWKWKFTLW